MAASARDTPLRTALLAVVVLAGLFLALNLPAAVGATDGWDRFRTEGAQVADPANGTTVFTSHEAGDLVAVGPDGWVQYHEGHHDGYFDVDPVPGTESTVLVAVTDHGIPACNPVGGVPCSRQAIERINLATGEQERLFSRVIPRLRNNEWHDVDRVAEDRFVVADTN
jgi:hypothetical protein